MSMHCELVHPVMQNHVKHHEQCLLAFQKKKNSPTYSTPNDYRKLSQLKYKQRCEDSGHGHIWPMSLSKFKHVTLFG